VVSFGLDTVSVTYPARLATLSYYKRRLPTPVAGQALMHVIDATSICMFRCICILLC